MVECFKSFVYVSVKVYTVHGYYSLVVSVILADPILPCSFRVFNAGYGDIFRSTDDICVFMTRSEAWYGIVVRSGFWLWTTACIAHIQTFVNFCNCLLQNVVSVFCMLIMNYILLCLVLCLESRRSSHVVEIQNQYWRHIDWQGLLPLVLV